MIKKEKVKPAKVQSKKGAKVKPVNKEAKERTEHLLRLAKAMKSCKNDVGSP
jgi:hypothetical protein